MLLGEWYMLWGMVCVARGVGCVARGMVCVARGMGCVARGVVHVARGMVWVARSKYFTARTACRSHFPLPPVLLQFSTGRRTGGLVSDITSICCSRSRDGLLSGTQFCNWHHYNTCELLSLPPT